MAVVNGESVSHPTLIGSVQRALRLLEAVGAHPEGAPAKQLAREAGLPLPTTYHLLRTLTHEGYLRRENGVFVFGEAADSIGRAGAHRRQRHQLADALAVVSKKLNAAVYFAVYREGEVELLAVSNAPGRPPVEEWVDFRATAHAHAIGQCLLAQLDEAARKEHLSRYPVQSITPFSVRTEDDLLHRLDTVRRCQVAYEHQEYALGTVCSAIPVQVGSAVAALAVSLPAGELHRLRSVTDRLRKMAEATLTTLAFSISI
ncbi:IclR family transcriptional regulator [Streptomyces pinistramenti]|uniref:IclR family transcriptional regulator n=1 Tax=Streptomyces pinistramenti TaxID=2884812 RepID=UPI001D07A909|nr:IclR family transcriptional regulator C-terminal domain-containing protein [Streptomyces pinistramenti]MCB5912235.1 helix-turn-helix domain-containing protein [Streptomyces pinistramenti]